MSYQPNYAMYSKPDPDWHDEPFEYVFTFSQNFGAPVASPAVANLFNQPMQFDHDADFYVRGMGCLVDQTQFEGGVGPIFYNMRLRDAFGRALDNDFVPMTCYAISPFFGGVGPPFGSPTATAWYPELYCPRSCVMFADFQAQLGASQFFSFHLYFMGVKRFKNEECAPK